jgi:hypothetical protein
VPVRPRLLFYTLSTLPCLRIHIRIDKHMHLGSGMIPMGVTMISTTGTVLCFVPCFFRQKMFLRVITLANFFCVLGPSSNSYSYAFNLKSQLKCLAPLGPNCSGIYH